VPFHFGGVALSENPGRVIANPRRAPTEILLVKAFMKSPKILFHISITFSATQGVNKLNLAYMDSEVARFVRTDFPVS
jgi:hypothetical protein